MAGTKHSMDRVVERIDIITASDGSTRTIPPRDAAEPAAVMNIIAGSTELGRIADAPMNGVELGVWMGVLSLAR